MKIKLLILNLCVLSLTAQAQNMISMYSQLPTADTLQEDMREQALRYPSPRRASVTATAFGSGNFDSKINGKDLTRGKSENARISSFFNLPINKWDGNMISATIYHNEQFFHVKNVNNSLPAPQLNNGHIRKSTLGLSLNFSRNDHFFKAPVIYSAVFTGISDNLSSVKRFNFNGSIIFPLKRTADTYLAIGVLVLIDPSAPLPVLPSINYFKRLNRSGLQLIVDLPQGVTLKQQLSQKAWVYFGANSNTYASFYHPGNPSLPERFSYNTIELKSGPGFEYLLGKSVILGLSGGVNSFTSATAIAKGDHYNDAFIKSTNKAVPYAEFSISLLPF